MSSTIFAASYSCPPGEYEESEFDHKNKKRAVSPVRVRGNPEQARPFYFSQRQRRRKSKLYVSGVHTFTEPAAVVLPVQDQIIDSFESMVFAGQDSERFIRLWYLHEDKGRPELHWNFNMEDLKSGRLVTLYYRERDWAIFEVWEELINRRYGLRSRRDPALAKLLKVSYRSALVRHPDKFEKAKSRVEDLSLAGLQSRDDLCRRLEACQVQVVETRPKWLRADCEFGSLTLTGACCHEGFTSPDYLATVMAKKESRWQNRFTSTKWLESEFARLMVYRAQWLVKALNGGKPRFGIQVPVIAPDLPLEQVQRQLQINLHHERARNEHPENGASRPFSRLKVSESVTPTKVSTIFSISRPESNCPAVLRRYQRQTAKPVSRGDANRSSQQRAGEVRKLSASSMLSLSTLWPAWAAAAPTCAAIPSRRICIELSAPLENIAANSSEVI